MKHIDWLKDTGTKLKTADGRTVSVLEFRHQKDDTVLSDLAKHLRNHYCEDSAIDALRSGTGHSRTEYLVRMKLPDEQVRPGPSIRSGDFGEILVADYLQFCLEFWVPRTQYCDKAVRNESTKGCDIIGFRILDKDKVSSKDTLAVYEAKAKFSGNRPVNRLQEAVDDSAKDVTRKAESLNFIKQKLIQKGQAEEALRVERFQSPEDRPYREMPGAVALFSTGCYDARCVSKTNTAGHPNRENLALLVVHGEDMMTLVHSLYRRAADEA